MRGYRSIYLFVLMLLFCSSAIAAEPAEKYPTPWRGVHLLSPGHDGVPLLKRTIAEGLAPLGVNALILEVTYNFRYQSHPDLGSPWGLTREDARELAETCRKHGVRLIPMFNCLGHQSWAKTTFALLKKHPEFDETPDAPADNAGIYCRSWCPLHPDVNAIAFALMDELGEAFGSDSMHVGLDEVFLIASEQCSRCRGKDPAELFARAVNDYHRHLVDEKKWTMLMWGDRLLDAKATGYGKWEASANGTAPAVDLIPKDIVICDWHYEPMKTYPSLSFLREKGFRVWPSSWKDLKAAQALRDAAKVVATDQMVGHLATTWISADEFGRALLGEPGRGKGHETATQVVAALKAVFKTDSGR